MLFLTSQQPSVQHSLNHLQPPEGMILHTQSLTGIRGHFLPPSVSVSPNPTHSLNGVEGGILTLQRPVVAAPAQLRARGFRCLASVGN